MNNPNHGVHVTLKAIAVVITALMLASCASAPKQNNNDFYANSVKITNVAGNHGGTGIVLRSNSVNSLVLTNSHVCGVVEQGGLVSGRAGQFMVTGYKRSLSADLCLIKVAGNLQARTDISPRPPTLQYEKATVSGHPALMPNVQTHGHFSGRAVIPILVGIKKCTPDDLADEKKVPACVMLGGLPIVKEFESILVTATIMPGSSGSGVYNEKGQLAGVVFAGSGTLGYAWTVPYEAMVNFLVKEAKTLPYQRPSNELDIFGGEGESKGEGALILNLKKVCSGPDRAKISELCSLADQDFVK